MSNYKMTDNILEKDTPENILLFMQLKPYGHTKNAQMNSPYLSLLKKESPDLNYYK